MKNYIKKATAIMATTTLLSTAALAIDDGPRMYWNAPVGLNILQTYAWNIHGNQITPTGGNYEPDASVNMNIAIMGYNRIFDFAGHASIFTAVLSAGNISGEVLGRTQSARGYGDIYFQGTFNLFGAPALSAEEFATYEQGTVLSLILGLSTPTGKYDKDSALNMGTNQWAGKIALPFMQTIGDWSAGEITTLEIIPAVWFYSDNNDYTSISKTLKKDPLYSVEAHLTQDITPTAFVSLDYMYQNGGEGNVDDSVVAAAINSDMAGLTFAYMLNQQLQFQFRYSSSLNPSDTDLSADILEFNFNYFW